MTKYLNRIPVLFFLCIVSLNLQAQVQTNFLDQLAEKFQKYCQQYPREEIYVHTDREAYVAGEDIWLEAYLVDRQSLRPSNESNIAYLEVLNTENRPVVQKRIKLYNGFGSGQITLPDTLSSGTFTIRAYTNWMKNFLPGNCFLKTVSIFNALNNSSFSQKSIQATSQRELKSGTPENLSLTGFSVSVINLTADSVALEVRSDRNFRSKEGNLFYLFVQTRGNIDLRTPLNISSDITRIILSKRDLTPGINDAVIFSSSGKLLAERLIYTTNKEMKNLTLNSSGKYSIRDKITVDISLKGIPDSASGISNLSISVAPAKAGSFPDIGNYLVLGSEFGPQPGASGITEFKGLSEDNLNGMLSSLKSNWIDWDLIRSGNWPVLKYERETTSHFLYGRLINNNSKAPDPDRYLFLSIPGKNAIFEYSMTDSNGEFKFAVPVDDQLRDLIIQPEETEQKDVIKQESSFSEKYADTFSSHDTSTATFPDVISRMKVNYQIGKIYKSEDTAREAPPRMFVNKSTRFYGKPDIELKMDNYIKLPVMQEVFFELMPGVFLKSKKSKYEITLSDPVENRVYERPPLLFVDGVVVNDASVIANLDPELVDRIDAVREKYFVGDYMFYGLVNVITKAGNFSNVALPDYVVRTLYRVTDPVKLFKSPAYPDTESKQSRIPDFRNTLYWNPSVKADMNGNAKVEFWSSDFASDFEIVVEGMTADGNPLCSRKIISVK
jgi:hypothetical protein